MVKWSNTERLDIKCKFAEVQSDDLLECALTSQDAHKRLGFSQRKEYTTHWLL